MLRNLLTLSLLNLNKDDNIKHMDMFIDPEDFLDDEYMHQAVAEHNQKYQEAASFMGYNNLGNVAKDWVWTNLMSNIRTRAEQLKEYAEELESYASLS